MTVHTGTQSMERGAQLLVHVVEEDEAPTVGELAQLAGLPKSTTSRLVGALERQGLVQRDPARGAIKPGPVLLRYARKETSGLDLVELAAGALERLARASGETVNLGVATSTAVEMLDQRDSRHILGSTNWVGQRVPHHGSVIGKVFLAGGALPIPDGPLEPLAPRTITDPAELRRDLERTRARGYATAIDELEPGLWAVAAPVRDAGGTVIAALSISGPTVRLHDGLLDELGRLARDEASTLSIRIGYDDLKRGAA
ncbi:MAG: IclR family transcriptional regulator [Thermoleophilia bacterium]|nr:IclR family transcriptional regulator [Thermoleophilia bacterium]